MSTARSGTVAPLARGGGLYGGYVLAVLVLMYTLNFIDRVGLGILVGPIKAELHLTDKRSFKDVPVTWRDGVQGPTYGG